MVVLLTNIFIWVIVACVEAIQYGNNSVSPNSKLHINSTNRDALPTIIFNQTFPISQAAATTILQSAPTSTLYSSSVPSNGNDNSTTSDSESETNESFSATIEYHDQQDKLIVHQKRLWEPDWEESSEDPLRWWPLLGTAALAAIAIQNHDEVEARMKRQRIWTPSDDLEISLDHWSSLVEADLYDFDVGVAADDVLGQGILLPPDNSTNGLLEQPEEFDNGDSEYYFHPLVDLYLGKRGDLDILRERLYDHDERVDSLELERMYRDNLGEILYQHEEEVDSLEADIVSRYRFCLSPDDQAYLDKSQATRDELLGHIQRAEEYVEEIRQQGLSMKLIDADGEPIIFSGHSQEENDWKILEMVGSSLDIPEPANLDEQISKLEQYHYPLFSEYAVARTDWDPLKMELSRCVIDQLDVRPNTHIKDVPLDCMVQKLLANENEGKILELSRRRNNTGLLNECSEETIHETSLQELFAHHSAFKDYTLEPWFSYNSLPAEKYNVIGRINHWLLHNLERSPLEFCRLANAAEYRMTRGGGDSISESSWRQEVLRHLETNWEPNEYVSQGSSLPSTYSLSLKEFENRGPCNLIETASDVRSKSVPHDLSPRDSDCFLPEGNGEFDLPQFVEMIELDEMMNSFFRTPEAVDLYSANEDLQFFTNEASLHLKRILEPCPREDAVESIEFLDDKIRTNMAEHYPFDEQCRVDVVDSTWDCFLGELPNYHHEIFFQDLLPSGQDSAPRYGTAPMQSSPQSSTRIREDSTLTSSPPDPTPASSSLTANTYTCENCSQKYSRAGDLRKHGKYHKKPISCPVENCAATFATNKDLKRHLKGPHGDGAEEYFCTYEDCKKRERPRRFTRRDNWLKHLRGKHGGDEGRGGGKVERSGE